MLQTWSFNLNIHKYVLILISFGCKLFFFVLNLDALSVFLLTFKMRLLSIISSKWFVTFFSLYSLEFLCRIIKLFNGSKWFEYLNITSLVTVVKVISRNNVSVDVSLLNREFQKLGKSPIWRIFYGGCLFLKHELERFSLFVPDRSITSKYLCLKKLKKYFKICGIGR